MPTRLKRIAIAVAVLGVVLFVLGVVVLPPVIRPVVESAAAARGVDMEMGSLRVNLLRGQVALGDLVVGNPPGYADGPLATVDACAVRAGLLPILRGDITVHVATAKRPVLNLERRASGEINLLALLDRLAGPATEAGEADTPESDAPEAPAGFRLDRLTLDDMVVRWTDHTVSGEPAELVLENMDVSIRDLYRPMPPEVQDTVLKMTGQFGGGASGSVSVEGRGNFLGETLNFDLTITLEELALASFNAYARSVPLQATAGLASGTVAATCVENQVDAVATLQITNLKLEPNSGAGLAVRLPSSVLATVGNLDPNHNVEVRVTGDIRDPEFHLMSAILLALVADIADLGTLVTGDGVQELGDRAAEAIGGLMDRLPFGRRAE